MKQITVFLLVALFSSFAWAQETEVSKYWSGEIDLGMKKLRIDFEIRSSASGSPTGVMNVLDQNAKNIPIQILLGAPDSLNILVPMVGAAYKGRLVSPDRIEGMFVQNGMSLELNLTPQVPEVKRPQTPKPPYAYQTEEVVFTNKAEGASLAGTLTYPVGYDKSVQQAIPVVLMVSGSGSQDRNEEVFGHKPFLVIADYLAKHGIASLRYDDRGVGGSIGKTEGMTTENNLSDAQAGIAFLRGLGQFGPIGLLGHSEGGMIGFMMGANRSIDFLISLAGPGIKGVDILVGQTAAMMQLQGMQPDVVNSYTQALRILCAERILGQIENPEKFVDDLCAKHAFALPESLKRNLVQCATWGGDWLTWFLSYDPTKAISQVTCPTMILNGRLDMQVLCEENISAIETHLPKQERNVIKVYDSLNHLFQHCTPATALDYGAIEETISEEVLADMVRWINSLR